MHIQPCKKAGCLNARRWTVEVIRSYFRYTAELKLNENYNEITRKVK